VSTTPLTVSYDIIASAKAANIIQNSENDLSIQFSTYVATTDSVVLFKPLKFVTGIVDFATFSGGL
jgi:hypothetical protein